MRSATLRSGMGIASMATTALAVACLVLPACATENARSAGTVIDDGAITAKVKTQLIADEDTKARQINVETSRGVVQLNGFVDSTRAKTEAGRIASDVEGVTRVENNLEVRTADNGATAVGAGENAVDNGALSAKVDAALAADPRTSALSVDVETRNDEVQLSGFVDNKAEKLAAVDVARKVAGVHAVKDAIAIR